MAILALSVGCQAPSWFSLSASPAEAKTLAIAGGDFREESIYFVMTDRFVDGDKTNNDLFGDEFRPGDLKFNQGGDFKGLINNLDHITAMGFTALWITPPVMQPPGRYFNDSRSYEASGYHGYWAWDFSKIDPHLESPGASYDDLIRECHKRGLKVVQDIVCNHGHGSAIDPSVRWASERGVVKGVGLSFNVDDDTQNWFTHGQPQIADLMDFNDSNPKVLEWMAKIYEQYQDRGVDAFRIDTVAWMKHEFWTGFTDRMHAHKPGFFMFGEAWTNSEYEWLAAYTKLGTGTGSPMNKGMSVLDMPGSAMNTWGQLEATFKGGDYGHVDSVLAHDGAYSDATYLVTFLDNHDKPRFNGTGGGDGRDATTEQYLDGLNWYFTARGIPSVYYGTETRMAGGNDPDNRRVLGPEGIKAAKGDPVYRQLTRLNAMRKAFKPLQKGGQRKLVSSPDTYGFRRDFGVETALVFLNKGQGSSRLTAQGVPDGNYRDLTSGASVTIAGARVEVDVPAHGVRVLALGNVKGTPWSSWKISVRQPLICGFLTSRLLAGRTLSLPPLEDPLCKLPPLVPRLARSFQRSPAMRRHPWRPRIPVRDSSCPSICRPFRD